MSHASDFEELHEQLHQFAQHVPGVLCRAKLTEELAKDIVATLSVAKSHFTMAVAGQMKVGKSTLINSMIGADLAIPGVNETTATVNWFRYGTVEQASQFRVVWNDAQQSSEMYDLSEKEKWLGNSEMAARTRYLEFFSPADFLKKVHVVDTPGTRSTIESHGEVSQGFLHAADRAEADTLFYGGIADCICYVLPHVTRIHDNEFLSKFAAESRLPQSSPYNSVGLLHKWEMIQDPAPWNVAARQSETAFNALKSYLCDVIPVSGPLGRACQICPDSFWQNLVDIVAGTTADAFELLTSQESRFTRDEPECCFSNDRRQELLNESHLPWPCFKVVLLLARSRKLSSGDRLLSAVREISGIDRLLEFLDRRFFDRSRLIHASTVLCRALRVTETARGRIRDRRSELEATLAVGRQAMDEVGTSETFPKARAFIERHLSSIAVETAELEEIQRELEQHTGIVQQSFEAFELDCRAVQALDSQPSMFDPEERIEIMRLLGAYGTSISHRLGVNVTENLTDLLYDRLDYWLVRRMKESGDARFVIERIVARIESVIKQMNRRVFT